MADTPDASGATTGMEFAENRVAQDLSARHEYNMLQAALHLPNFNELVDQDEAAIAAHISNSVSGFRQRFAAIALFTRSDAEQQFLAAYNQMLGSKAPSRIVQGFRELTGDRHARKQENIARAKAFLKVLHQNLSTEDVRRFVQQLSRINTNVANAPDTVWESAAPITINGLAGIIRIDLSQPMWQGTAANIRARLANRMLNQAGIQFVGPGGIPIALPPAVHTHRLTEADINAIFGTQCEIRDPNTPANNPPAHTTMSLADAFASTAALAQLAAGNADSRELLLALAAIRRDPTAAQVLGGGNRAAELTAARARLEQEQALSTALAKLEKLETPSHDLAHIRAALHALNIATPPAGTRDSGWSTLQSEKIKNETHHLKNAQDVLDTVNQIMAFVMGNNSLRPLLVTPAAGVNLAYLRTFLLPAPPAAPTGVDEGAIINPANAFNPGRLVQSVRSAFNQTAGTDKSPALGSVERYTKLLEENLEQLTKAQEQSVDNGPNACWAVIRRSLEHEGLRGNDLESVIGHMRGELQQTADTPKQIEAMAAAAIPPKLDDEEAEEKWSNSEKRSFRQISKLGLKTDPWKQYKERLFNKEAIGMSLTDDPMDKDTDLKVVIDAYFTTKYLQSLPEDDVKSLPKSPEIRGFMRKLHSAILERAQSAFSANAIPSRDLEALRAEGLGVDASKLSNLTMTERLTAVQTYLGGTDSTSIANNPHYTAEKKAEIEAIATQAFKPIQKKIDSHNWWKEGWKNRAGNIFKGDGSGWNPLIWPAQFVRKFVGGEGTAKNPLTWPSKAIQWTVKAPFKAVPSAWNWLLSPTNPAAAAAHGNGHEGGH